MKPIHFFGREHFIELGKVQNKLHVAHPAFYLLVGKKAFPEDNRLPDFQSMGLLLVSRENTDLGEVPDWARYARQPNGSPQSPTSVCEDYAIESATFRSLVTGILQGEVIGPRGFNGDALPFCNELLTTNGFPAPEDGTA